MLCDDILVMQLIKDTLEFDLAKKIRRRGNSKKVVRGHKYILCYSRSDELTLNQKSNRSIGHIHIKKWKQGKNKNKHVLKNGKLYFVNNDIIRRVFGKYEKGIEKRCEYENLLKFRGKKLVSGEYILDKAKNGMHLHLPSWRSC